MTSSNQTIKPYTDAELDALEAACGPGEPTVLRLVREVRMLRRDVARDPDEFKDLHEAFRWDRRAFTQFVQVLLEAKRVDNLPMTALNVTPEIVALGVMDEREECAKCADRVADAEPNEGAATTAWKVAVAIAHAIRARSAK